MTLEMEGGRGIQICLFKLNAIMVTDGRLLVIREEESIEFSRNELAVRSIVRSRGGSDFREGTKCREFWEILGERVPIFGPD
jgi:hypothetical protein